MSAPASVPDDLPIAAWAALIAKAAALGLITPENSPLSAPPCTVRTPVDTQWGL